MFRKSYIGLITLAVLLAILVACSGGNGGSPDRSFGGSGTVNVGISDPPTCAASNGGTYDAIFVTITDVKIHTSDTAGPNDSGWIDLTPNMTPTQINLLGNADSRCLLASLKQSQQLTAGTYQQVRIFLAPNSVSNQITNNACGNGVSNCVVIGGTPSPLVLSSETNTGIKIPSGQIAGGQFKIASGETKDLVLDFDGCASIVAQGGQYRLKPTLHAGEVQLGTSMKGQLVDSISNQGVSGKAIVTLQRRDSNNINRVIMQTSADISGNFILCPIPALPTGSSYDLVATAYNTSSGTQYATTVIVNVTPGQNVGPVPMVAQTTPNIASFTIDGQVTTSKTPAAATPADIMVSALQQISYTVNNTQTTYNITVPLARQQSATLNLATGTTSCPASTNCVNYQALLPASWPNIGITQNGTISFTQSTASPVLYSVEAQAFVQGSAGTPDCTQPVQTVSKTTTNADLAATPGGSLTAQTISFTGCQ